MQIFNWRCDNLTLYFLRLAGKATFYMNYEKRDIMILGLQVVNEV